MIEKSCNLWLEPADYRCILTSAAVANGEAVLESPSARQAAERYTGLAGDLGRLLNARGNRVHEIRPGVCSFPTRQFRWSGPSLEIIERSARELVELVKDRKALLPRPGCDAGELEWAKVAEKLAFLPDNIIIVA